MKKLLTSFLVVATFTFAESQPNLKPAIGVSVKIAERNFEETFGAVRQRIEKRVADSISTFLSINYAVFSFTSMAQTDVMSIEIKRPWAYRKAALSYPVEVVIRFRGVNVEPLTRDSIKWTLAHDNRWPEWLTDDDNVVNNIIVRFKECIGDNEESFFRMLRRRWFVEGVAVLKVDKSSKRWRLNLSYSDLGIGFGTQFKVLQNHKDPTRILRYYIEAKSVISSKTIDAQSFDPKDATEPTDRLEELSSFESVSNIQVFKITPFSPINKPISSTQVKNGKLH